MASLAEVAEAAGVSAATVSRVLNGHGRSHRISEETVKRVREIADTLGYSPSYHARALRLQRAGAIGVLLNSGSLLGQGQAWTASILGGLDLGVRLAGSNVQLIGDREKYEVLNLAWQNLDQGRVDALVIFDYVLSRYRQNNIEHSLPDTDTSAVVVIGQDYGYRHARVDLDVRPGLHEAVTSLWNHGHRRFTWLFDTDADQRGVYVSELVRDLGGTCQLLNMRQGAPNSAVSVSVRASRMADHLGDATACLCFNDVFAIGLMSGLQQLGRQPGRDISVVGVDDLFSHVTVPALSSVHMPLDALGKQVAAFAMEMGNDPQAVKRLRGTVTSMPSYYIERDSTHTVTA